MCRCGSYARVMTHESNLKDRNTHVAFGEMLQSCSKCGEAFNDSDTKHHCRACGEGFCDGCSSKSRPVPERGWGLTPVRVCDACFQNRGIPEGEKTHTLHRLSESGFICCGLARRPCVRSLRVELVCFPPMVSSRCSRYYWYILYLFHLLKNELLSFVVTCNVVELTAL